MVYSITGFSYVCDIGSENNPSYDVRRARVFDPRFSWVLERVFTSYNFAYILHGSKMAK